MISTYEISIPLESGYTLTLITAEGDEAGAIREARKVLRSIGVHGTGERASHLVQYDPEDITAREVHIDYVVTP